MILAQAAVDVGGAKAIEPSMPGVSRYVGAKRNSVVHLAEGKGFVTAVVPSGTAEGAEIRRQLLFEVHPKARLCGIRGGGAP